MPHNFTPDPASAVPVLEVSFPKTEACTGVLYAVEVESSFTDGGATIVGLMVEVDWFPDVSSMR